MAAIFGEGKIFGCVVFGRENSKFLEKLPRVAMLRYPVCRFWQKFENSKWSPFLGRGKFLKIGKSRILIYPVGRKFAEIALSRAVKEILANYSKVVLKIHNEVPKWLLLMY